MTNHGRWLGVALLAAALGGMVCASVSADVIYEDVYYWAPGTGGGIDVYRNPSDPPLDAYVKIQETVYDDTQGRAHLDLLLNTIGAVHGNPIPVAAFDLYVYSITNLTYAPPPPSGTGRGVAGYEVDVDALAMVLGQWSPNAANNAWTGGGDALGTFWDINADQDADLGDGWGIAPTQTFAGFMFAVAAGTPHGLNVPASIWNWTGEEPGGVEFGEISGFVSGPIPEPATMGLVAMGLSAIFLRRKRSA